MTIKRSTSLSAFTLVELMISIALMVALMVGVNYIFSSVTKATSAGQALSKITQNSQAAQSVMSSDFTGIAVSDAPCLLLMSRAQPAFLNRADQQSAADPSNPLVYMDPASGGTGTATYNTTNYNDRNHRVDVLSFFSRGLFPRQTGNNGVYVADQSSQEAWIWYGHLTQPDNSANYYYDTANPPKQPLKPGSYNPSDTTPYVNGASRNPNNFYAQQWILGRVAIGLQQPDTSVNPPAIYDNSSNAVPQRFFYRKSGTLASSLIPLEAFSTDDLSDTRPWLQESRYDLAGTSIAGFRQIIQAFIDNAIATSNPNADWWSRLMLDDNGSASTSQDRRFHCNPIVNRPIDSAAVSGQSPIFMPSCTQFMVEYAGDFLTQNPTTGQITGTCYNQSVSPPVLQPTDGEIDYCLVTNGGVKERRIQWYGLPRDTYSKAGPQPDGAIVTPRDTTNYCGDVLPLRDLWLPAGQTAPFEKLHKGPAGNDGPLAMSTPMDYATTGLTGSYVCAWGPADKKPSLIRITMVLDDPNGRLGQGQTLQFVFKIQ